jgi:Ca2+-binding EF-hand superfamily protein
LSKEEVRNGYLKHFGRKISDQELNRIFNTLDSDKNGFIDNSEVQNDNERDELRRAFTRFDKNKDGKLSKEEIKKGYLKYYKR